MTYTSELTPAQIAILEAAVSIGAEPGNTNTGKIDWHYDIVDKNLDFLGVGESLTVTAPILIDDHNNAGITMSERSGDDQWSRRQSDCCRR